MESKVDFRCLIFVIDALREEIPKCQNSEKEERIMQRTYKEELVHEISRRTLCYTWAELNSLSEYWLQYILTDVNIIGDEYTRDELVMD